MFTFFSVTFGINKISAFLLVLLFLYTLFLIARGSISAQNAVRWIVAELFALFVFVTWRYLPFFHFTSTLSDRQLLLVVVVIFFALMCFLMLDALVQISRLTGQVKTLTQELALLRLRVDVVHSDPSWADLTARERSQTSGASNIFRRPPRPPLQKKDCLALLWMASCGIFLYLSVFKLLPKTILNFFTAAYQQ